MTAALPPPPPPRARAASASDGELVREVIALSTRCEERFARLEAGLAEVRASGKSESLKVIASAVVSVVLAVVGARATAPAMPPPQVTVTRSAFDRALDECRRLPEGNRGECVVRVLQQSTGGPQP